MKHLKKTLHLSLKITNIFLTLAVLLILPVVVFTLISSKTDKVFGIQSFVVLTGSMNPKIPVGSVIFTKPMNSYRNQDVIAFNQKGRVITHRVVDSSLTEKGAEYITKGDANKNSDSEKVLGASVVGKQIVSIPYLGIFIKFLSTIQGFLIFIVSPIALFVLLELWNIKKELEKSIEKKLLKKMSSNTNFDFK